MKASQGIVPACYFFAFIAYIYYDEQQD